MMSSFGISRDQVFRRPWKRSPQASGWPTNLTRAEVRLSNASDFWNGSGHETWTWDSDTNASAFDLTSGTFTVPSSFEFALENGTAVEYHWQMRSIVDHRIGAWSTAAGFCVPDAHGTDDGTANYTVILREGSICEGHPEYLDGTLTNGTTVVDNGVDSTMDLGADRSGSDKLTASSPSISGITGSRMR